MGVFQLNPISVCTYAVLVSLLLRINPCRGYLLRNGNRGVLAEKESIEDFSQETANEGDGDDNNYGRYEDQPSFLGSSDVEGGIYDGIDNISMLEEEEPSEYDNNDDNTYYNPISYMQSSYNDARSKKPAGTDLQKAFHKAIKQSNKSENNKKSACKNLSAAAVLPEYTSLQDKPLEVIDADKTKRTTTLAKILEECRKGDNLLSAQLEVLLKMVESGTSNTSSA